MCSLDGEIAFSQVVEPPPPLYLADLLAFATLSGSWAQDYWVGGRGPAKCAVFTHSPYMRRNA